MRLVASGLLAALVLAAPAAAAPWSSPAPIPGAVDSFPVLATSSTGPKAVYWQQSLVPANPATSVPATFVSVLGPDLVPTPAFLAGNGFGTTAVGSMPIVDGEGNVVLPGQRGRSVGWVARGPLRRPRYQRSFYARPRLTAANPAGDHAVLVDPCRMRGCKKGSPAVYVHRDGEDGFRRRIVVDRPGRGYGSALAIDGRGRILVAWDRDDRVFARWISSRGRLGRLQLLGYERTPAGFSVTIAPDGRAAVAWTTQRVSEGHASTGWRARVSIAARNGRFPGGRVIERVGVTGTGRYVPYAGLVIRLDASGGGLAAWTGIEGDRFVVRAAPVEGTRVADGTVMSDIDVDTVLADAALGPGGSAVVLMLPGRRGADPPLETGPQGLTAAVRAAGTVTFVPEQIVTGREFVDGAYVAFDGATRRPFVTWRQVGAPIGWSARDPL